MLKCLGAVLLWKLLTGQSTVLFKILLCGGWGGPCLYHILALNEFFLNSQNITFKMVTMKNYARS